MRLTRHTEDGRFARAEDDAPLELILPEIPSVPLTFRRLQEQPSGDGQETVWMPMTRRAFVVWAASELEEPDPDTLPDFYVEDEPQAAGRSNARRKRRIRGRGLDELRAEKRAEMEADFDVEARALIPSPWLAAALDHGDTRIQQLAEMGRKLQARYREIDRSSKEGLREIVWLPDDGRRY